eukprot:g4581.t1
MHSIRVRMNSEQTVDDLKKIVGPSSKLVEHKIPHTLHSVHGARVSAPLQNERTIRSMGVVVEGQCHVEERMESLTRCDICKQTTKGLKTYNVNWERVCLCKSHDAEWLDELMSGGPLEESDMCLLSKDLVLANLRASVL